MSIPGEYDNTLGRQAGYSPTRRTQGGTPFKPQVLHYQQQDTAFREPKSAPKPTFPPPSRSRKERARRFCTKPRIILASIALVVILLLLLVLPLALTMKKGKKVEQEKLTGSTITAPSTTDSPFGHDIFCEYNCTESQSLCQDYFELIDGLNCTVILSDCSELLANCSRDSLNDTLLDTNATTTDNATLLTPSTQPPRHSTPLTLETSELPNSTLPSSSTEATVNTTVATEPTTAPSSRGPLPSTGGEPGGGGTTPRSSSETAPLTTPLWKPKSPPVANCSGFDFRCLDERETVGQLKVCDGVRDCSDGSDENDCLECRTSFSCPMEEGTGLKKCLRGKVLCDKVRDCPTLLDETLYCRKTCQLGVEYKCKGADICVPIEWMCDGDTQCPMEDDEDFCTSSDMCGKGAKFCGADKRCIPEWSWCDGVAHCSDGADERECNCNFCSGRDRVLCRRPTGKCIKKTQLCDGHTDCQDGEDEQNCPGWCEPEGEVEKVRCVDGKEYPKRWACSGVIQACAGMCPVCDAELAFKCLSQQFCIPRRQICDGVPDCGDGSDERAELCGCTGGKKGDLGPFRCQKSVSSLGRLKCIPAQNRCDGYRDCPESEDELDCPSCYHNPLAFYCETERACFPSSSRCDGEVNCPDYSDEDHCTCAECTSQLYQTFLCKSNSRCLRKDYVCNERSLYHCPGAVPEDEQFCRPNFDPLNP